MLQVDRHDAVTLLRLHRPDGLNAIDAAMETDAFAAFEADAGSERAFAGTMFALEPLLPLAALRTTRKP